MEQAIWRGMPYYDVFWRKRHLTRRELHAVYANYYAYIFWSLVICLVVLLDLHGFAERVSLTGLVTYAISLVVVTVTLYIVASDVGIRLSERYSWFVVFTPPIGFAAVSISTFIVEIGMSGYFGGQISLEHAAEKLPVNLILTLVLETFFITFVLPVATSSVTEPENHSEPNDKKTCVTLSISGNTFYCNQLISVSSQDHYVRIKTIDGEKLIRARLSDLIGQLNCQKGIQPHRSHWVSRRAVSKITSQGGHKVLELRDGSAIPIARGRLVDVQAWLES